MNPNDANVLMLESVIVTCGCLLVNGKSFPLTYPLFVQRTRHLIRLRTLEPFFSRIQRAAASRGGVVRHFGIAGLFVFAPFWMTGPVVGAIIGFLIGLRPWLNLAVVLVATYIAIGVWALLLNELNAWASAVNPNQSAGLGHLRLFSIHEIRMLTQVFIKNYYEQCFSYFMNKEYA